MEPLLLIPRLTDFNTSCVPSTIFSSADLPPHLEKIKQQANDAFARQQWTQAIQLYNLGIHRASCNAMLYGNRAAAYMKRKWCVPAYAEMIYPQAMKPVIKCVCVFIYDSQGWRPLWCPQGLPESSHSKPRAPEGSFQAGKVSIWAEVFGWSSWVSGWF